MFFHIFPKIGEMTFNVIMRRKAEKAASDPLENTPIDLTNRGNGVIYHNKENEPNPPQTPKNDTP